MQITTVQITPYISVQGEEVWRSDVLGLAVVSEGGRTYSGKLLRPRPVVLGPSHDYLAELRAKIATDVDEQELDDDFDEEALA